MAPSRPECRQIRCSPLRHLNDLGQNVADLRAHRVEAVRGIHHEIRALALFGVGHLPRQDGIERLLCHGAARQDPLALIFRRRRHHHHGIDALLAAGLEQQRAHPTTTTGAPDRSASSKNFCGRRPSIG